MAEQRGPAATRVHFVRAWHFAAALVAAALVWAGLVAAPAAAGPPGPGGIVPDEFNAGIVDGSV